MTDSVVQRILIVEESATLRYILSKLVEKQNFELVLSDSFQSTIEMLQQTRQNLHAVIVGLTNYKHHAESKKLMVLLNREPYSELPVILLSNDVDLNLLNWTGTRPNAAMIPWENYQEAAASLQTMLQPDIQIDDELYCLSHTSEPTRVLFVDDSRSIVHYYSRLLKQNGYQVETANSVKQAYEIAQEKEFDIAIVDYFMPDENGYVLCQKLRDDERTESIRTAVITGTYLDSVIRDCLKAGAIECFFKNEAEELFLARVSAMSRFIEIQRSIEKQREGLAAILESVGEGVYGVDNDGRVTFANPATYSLLGLDDSPSLIGENACDIFHYKDEEQSMEEDQLRKAYKNREILKSWETRFQHQSGKAVPVECTLYPLNINDKQEGSVVAFRDISNQKMLEERLRWQATHDYLTEIYNRRYLETHLEEEIRHVQRSGIGSAIVYLDLDRFKYVNDAVGHDAGDRLLIEISNLLVKQLRRNDVVARIGGDEFAIILKNVDQDLAMSLADACREALTGLRVPHEDNAYHVQASVGVAMIEGAAVTAGDALADADIACHIAKRLGRNQTHLYDKNDDERNVMGSELGWSSRLREALKKNDFVLHFQPILDLHDIDLIDLPIQNGMLWKNYLKMNKPRYSYEVLIRMRAENGDLYLPDSFLPTAERFNMMIDIDMWVVEHALRALVALGSLQEKVCLSINLSGNTLDDDEAATRIKAIIEKYKVSPSNLVFEITETSAIANMNQANHFIKMLTEIGCRFSLDDFGSGFCSFSQLKSLSTDYVKIDGQFVKNMARGSTDRAIVTAMNDVAHSLSRQTVAEYVESPEVIRLLKVCGVDRVQGHYISPPLECLPHGNVVKLPVQLVKNKIRSFDF
ncbi:MAG: EAL domain-containing protein [Gammaproteobacteria bacterium]|nr:EAL domain-containing protein [Gammaproteobacteria bacterium]